MEERGFNCSFGGVYFENLDSQNVLEQSLDENESFTLQCLEKCQPCMFSRCVAEIQT